MAQKSFYWFMLILSTLRFSTYRHLISIQSLPISSVASVEMDLNPFQMADLFHSTRANIVVKQGESNRVVKVMINGFISDLVVQQPSNQPTFVSSEPNVVTQFHPVNAKNSIGLLAHNHLAGSSFKNIKRGDQIELFFEDGTLKTYQVKDILHYQALAPDDPYSNFLGMDSQTDPISSSELFNTIYGRPNQLILQTCISKGKIDSWGRLFILAIPFEEETLPLSNGSPWISLLTRMANYGIKFLLQQ